MASPAFLFVMTTGVVNLFGDITYQGGASINGPFMATLGASAGVVSITAGSESFSATPCVCLLATPRTEQVATG
jgi:hypothetical protein